MQPENPEHYALSKLAEASRLISVVIQEMPASRRKLESLMSVNKERARTIYEDLQKSLARIIDSLSVASLSLAEMEETELNTYTLKLLSSVKSFNIMTPDYSKLCNVLADYLKKLPSEGQTANAKVIGRLMNRIRLGYYPTNLEHISHIERAISFPQGTTTNLFDPCCGCGLALRALAQGNNCFTYGVELDESRADEALTRLHRVGFGSFFYSRISNEAFHAILLNPPYLSVLSENGQNFRSEKRFLVDSICHLMFGGLLIYIVPYYRLTEDVCKVLSGNFSDISVWKFYGDEFKKFNQIAVMGIRKKKEIALEQATRLASLAFLPEKIPELGSIPNERYALPKEAKSVELFKGSEFNVSELAEQLKGSKSFSKLFQKSKLDDMNKRPLLPLSIGQVGLVGGSGLINGLIECDSTHIIKGRIVKETRTKEMSDQEDSNYSTISETTTNKMVFNILTPYGFKSLA